MNHTKAKEIAAFHGIEFIYTGKKWLLHKRTGGVPAMHFHAWLPKTVKEMGVDEFTAACVDVAVNTMSQDQMQAVIRRQKFQASVDHFTATGEAGTYIDGYSNDRQVHAYEDAMWQMRKELEAIHGDYASHKLIEWKSRDEAVTASILAMVGVEHVAPAKVAPVLPLKQFKVTFKKYGQVVYSGIATCAHRHQAMDLVSDAHGMLCRHGQAEAFDYEVYTVDEVAPAMDDDANPDYVRGYNAGLVDAGLPDGQIPVPPMVDSVAIRFAKKLAQQHGYDVVMGVQYHATHDGEVLNVFTTEGAAWLYVFGMLDCQI